MADPSIYEFNWEEGRGLDLHLIEWESRVMKGDVLPHVLEMSQALYSAFIELRKIRKILIEGKPGIDHSFYQYRFEMFAHNHFLSIALMRVVKIFRIACPDIAQAVDLAHRPLLKRIEKYRNDLEHQTEINKRKQPPSFLNNLTGEGYLSESNSIKYDEIERLLNDIMRRIEMLTS